MQLELGRRADYAIRCVVDLARHHPDQRRAREISAEMEVPRSYVPAILGLLVEAGIVETQAGRSGGSRLSLDPADLTLLAVIEAADGELGSTTCVLRGGPCHWEDRCAVHEPWFRAQQAMRTELAGTTVAELAAADRTLENG